MSAEPGTPGEGIANPDRDARLPLWTSPGNVDVSRRSSQVSKPTTGRTAIQMARYTTISPRTVNSSPQKLAAKWSRSASTGAGCHLATPRNRKGDVRWDWMVAPAAMSVVATLVARTLGAGWGVAFDVGFVLAVEALY